MFALDRLLILNYPFLRSAQVRGEGRTRTVLDEAAGRNRVVRTGIMEPN